MVADIGRNLTLQSLQDTSTYNSQQTNFNAGLEIGAGGKLGGNAGGSQTSINSHYRSVIEQTAINAGTGGFDITVGGNTHLKGAIINSTANPEDNLLTTGTLTVSDINNSGQYEASRVNAGLNISGSLNTGADKPAGGSKGGSGLETGLGGLAFGTGGEASGTTKSAISAGTIIITDQATQQQLTGKDATTTIAGLNRDTQNANGSIANPFNLQQVEEQLEFLQVLGEDILKPVGAEAAKWIGDQFPPDPEHPGQIDPRKVAAHAALGAAMTTLLGTGWQGGALGGALGDVLPNILQKAFEKDENGKIRNEEMFKAANTLLAAILASGTGQDLASVINTGMTTRNAVENNWLKHTRPGLLVLSEKEQYDRAAKECVQGNQAQCESATELQHISDKRDSELKAVCQGGASAECSALAKQAWQYGNLVFTGPDGQTYAISKDANILKVPDRPVGFDTELAPFVIDAAMQEVGALYIGRLISAARPLASWAMDTLGLSAKNAIVAQAQRTDELVGLFDKNNAANSLALNGKIYTEIPYQKGSTEVMSNAKGTTKIIDTSSLSNDALQQAVFDYAKQLAGKDLIPHPTKPGVWYKALDDGTTINVRNFSSSGAGRWTVDVINPDWFKPLVNQKSVELKFK